MPTAVTGPAHQSRHARSGGAWLEAQRSGGGIAQAAAALLVLLALVGGVPAGLPRISGQPSRSLRATPYRRENGWWCRL
jgi:hypothetical protein